MEQAHIVKGRNLRRNDRSHDGPNSASGSAPTSRLIAAVRILSNVISCL